MNLNYHFIAIFRPIMKDEMNRNHTETMINSFTLSQLIEMSGDNRQGLMRECFTASSDNRMEIFRFPVPHRRLRHRRRHGRGDQRIAQPARIPAEEKFDLHLQPEEYPPGQVGGVFQGRRNRRFARFPAPHQHRHKKPAPAFPAIRGQPLPDAHARGKPLDTQFHRADRA